MPNLSNDILSQLNGLGYGQSKTINGMTYSPMGLLQNDEGGQNFKLDGYAAYSPGTSINTPGASYQYYSPTGGFAGNRKTLDGGSYQLSDFKDIAEAAAFLGSVYLGGQGLAAMGAGSAGGIGGTGFAAGGTGAGAGVGAGAVGGSGAFVGEGALSGIPAWDGALANALPGQVAGAGTGMNFANGFTDTGTAHGALDTGYAGSGALTGATGAVAPTGIGSTPGLSLPGGGIPSALSKLVSGSGGGSGSGLNLGNIVGLLSGAYGASQQTGAANDMLNYLKQRQSMNDNMYAPGSPEYNALWDEMSRKDAAAGRNSQYGPRSVDLAARIAQLKMNANTQLTSSIAKNMADSYNQRANAGANVTSMLPALLGTGKDSLGNISLSDITKWLSESNATGTTTSPSSISDFFQPEGGDIGQYL